jgi:hypothetical protein
MVVRRILRQRDILHACYGIANFQARVDVYLKSDGFLYNGGGEFSSVRIVRLSANRCPGGQISNSKLC